MLRRNAGSSDTLGLSSERGSASIFSRSPSSSFAVNMVGENTNALTMGLVKQFPNFKFSGERYDFQNWQDQWEEYVQLVRQVYGETSSYVLLSLLRDKMDNVTGKEITLRMRDPQVKYDEVYAEICRRFGEVGTNGRRWKRIRLARTSQGVSLAEWRRFKVELLSAVSQSFGEDEGAIREHVLVQLPESWRLAVVKQEMKRKSNSAVVRVGIPPGEGAERLFWELSAEVDGLARYELDGRSIRIECGSRAVQARMLEMNGCFLRIDGRESQLRIGVGELHCSIQEICEIVDQRVEELEEMRVLEEGLATTPVRVVAKEEHPSKEERGRNKERVLASPTWSSHGKGYKGGHSLSRASSSSRTSSQTESTSSGGICRVCRGLGLDSRHDYRGCAVSKDKQQGPFCSYCGSRGLEYKHEYSSCKRRLTKH